MLSLSSSPHAALVQSARDAGDSWRLLDFRFPDIERRMVRLTAPWSPAFKPF
jgi:hypothetical protein